MNNIYILIFMFYFVQADALELTNKNILILTPNCTKLKDIFANYSAEFTLCAIRNSRPITLCEKCINFYWDVKESYTNMSKVMENGTSCLDTLVNSDRLQIVLILYQNNVDLWTRAKCDECYENDNSRSISNQTLEFQTLSENFMKCVQNTDNAHVCLTCKDDYVKLDHYYKSISNINEKISICMDLVDIMNNTWTYWSTNCCKYRRHDEYIFIGTTVSVLVCTIAFYFIVQFWKEKNAPTIIQQSRIFASLNSLNLFGD